MYREKDIQDCLFGLVGFRQNVNPDYPTLTPAVIASSSGLYFQDAHPLICIENLDQALKNYDAFNYPLWLVGTEYDKNDRVKGSNGLIYSSVDDGNTGNDPTVSPAEWEPVNLLSQKLEAVVRAAANKVLAVTFTTKKIRETTKSIFENTQLFDGAGSLLDKEIKNSRFVGLQIIVENHRDLTTVIKRIGTQFSQVNPAFKLYVFHSSQETPIKEYELQLAKANSFEWTKLLDDENQELFLRYLDDNYAPGGAFYIGYYEDGLIGQAINKGYDFSHAPSCGTCNKDNSYYTAWSPFIRVTPMEVNAAYLIGKLPGDPGGPTLWDIRVNQYQYVRNFGLNLDLTVRCDVTDFLCREKHLFIDSILKQVTVDLLNIIAFSTRNNVIAKETRDLAAYELNNKDNHTPGATKMLEKSLAALDFDLSDLNESCLPGNRANGSTWGTI